jgi:hypothetical protein
VFGIVRAFFIPETKGLKYEPDGSLEIYVQNESPVPRESNWLTATAGPFFLTLRMYGPKPEPLSGAYKVPTLASSAPTSVGAKRASQAGSIKSAIGPKQTSELRQRISVLEVRLCSGDRGAA